MTTPHPLAPGWQREAYAFADVLFERDDGPPSEQELLWLIDDVEHFLLTVGGRSALVIRAGLFALSSLGPVSVGAFHKVGSFSSLSRSQRQLALKRLDRGPTAMALFALKTLFSFHWHERAQRRGV